jgi:hypothetical protein
MKPRSTRYWIFRYTILTLALFVPLLWSFLYIRNLYPFTVWNVMMAGANLQTGRNYFVLRGETVSGQTVDVKPIKLTNALYSRTWTMVSATVFNQNFRLTSPHPDNARLIEQFGSVEKLPLGARMPELLETWGNLYNEQFPSSSPARLKAIRLDMYRWSSGRYADYDTFVESWRKEL